MALTDAAVKKAAARDKPYKMADAGGLFLYVAPTGLKSFRMKFTLGGKEKLLTFGPYPDMKLSEARERRDEVRRQLREGHDPSGARKRAEEQRAAARIAEAQLLTFEQAARQWWDLQRGRWTSVHAADVITSLERDVFPSLGGRPLVRIKAPDVLATLREVENRGSIETARRLRQRIGGVYDMFTLDAVTRDNGGNAIAVASAA